MKTALLTFAIACFFILCGSPVRAQTGNVTRKKGLLFTEYKYSLNGEKISEKIFFKQMAPNAEAYDLMKDARKNKAWAAVIGGAGSALFGAWVGAQFSLKENEFSKNKVVPAIGATLICASIPLRINYLKRSERAMNLYNEGLAEAKAPNKTEIRLGFTGSGLGLQLNF